MVAAAFNDAAVSFGTPYTSLSVSNLFLKYRKYKAYLMEKERDGCLRTGGWACVFAAVRAITHAIGATT